MTNKEVFEKLFNITIEQLKKMPKEEVIKWENEINKILWADLMVEKMSNLDDYYKKYGHPKPKTNADQIRSMTNEELALFIHNAEAQAADIGRADTVESWLEWLKQDYITFVAQEYEKDLNDRLNREGISP